MLMIRLQRTGRKNDPQFRVVVTEKQNGPKSGKFLEVLGSYNPKLGNFAVKKEKVQEWIAQGAQMSDTIFNHLVKEGIIEGKKKNVLPKKSPSPKRKEKK
ncbi:MAG: 30S ribosomal protein S16 [Candidatus Pacebacteria bacterium]|nr:30S ribosomal protein S16 [Candidatus Paceibacterota bacterium]